MSRTIVIVTALASVLPSVSFADSLDAGDQPSITSVASQAAPGPAPHVAPAAALGRHHVSIGFLGYFKSVSGDFVSDQDNFDASRGQCAFFNYRYSLDRRLDLALDARGWTDNSQLFGDKVTVMVTAVGPGLRCNFRPVAGRLYPYAQANGYLVAESINGNYIYDTTATTSSGIGFGLNAGVELRLSSRLSIPVEINFLWGRPRQDVTGFGTAIGISCSFGAIE